MGRLETMALMGMDLPADVIRRQIASGIDILVHLGRMRDRTRKVLQISELDGIHKDQIVLHPLYTFHETGEKGGRVDGIWKREGTLCSRRKLEEKGLEWPDWKNATG